MFKIDHVTRGLLLYKLHQVQVQASSVRKGNERQQQIVMPSSS